MDDDDVLLAVDDELQALLNRPRGRVRRALPQLHLYRSVIAWKRTGRFTTPFEDVVTARIQFWELDEHCAILDYKRRFVDEAVERFPDRRGFRLFQRVLGTISHSRSRFKAGSGDVQIYRRPDATMTIIGFGDIKGGFTGVGWTLFDRAIAEPLNANIILLRDRNRRIYLKGIESLGDYQTSIAKVRELLKEFAHTRIVATGCSGGVFGAINFSADLGVRHIVAFSGPTTIEIGEANSDRQAYRLISADIEAGVIERIDLAAKVNASAIDRIDFFVAGQSPFDMAQLNALRERSPKVVPHIYEDLGGHVITDYAIEDGSIFTAFNAGPQTPGLA
ncbi:hypothetical protein [Sphingomonas sp.]|uniref:hypothetical protein n=1 Tax=Sphingomonas sp. TaxID=28214 RepID=UPI0035C7D418